MGDMGDLFRSLREERRERREKNLENAFLDGTDGWTVHVPHHWSRDLLGERLDYWPSRNKFRWKGKTHTGNVGSFIRRRLREAEDTTHDG